MATDKVVQYTDEQTATVVNAYTIEGKSVEDIATLVGKSVRSVIAKLSREGVYQPKSKTATSTRVTKAQMIAVLAAKANVTSDQLESLEKASHDALALLVANLT